MLLRHKQPGQVVCLKGINLNANVKMVDAPPGPRHGTGKAPGMHRRRVRIGAMRGRAVRPICSHKRAEQSGHTQKQLWRRGNKARHMASHGGKNLFCYLSPAKEPQVNAHVTLRPAVHALKKRSVGGRCMSGRAPPAHPHA